MASTYQSILHDLHNGRYAPVYLFDGEEDFFIDELTDYIEEHSLDEAGKAFDLVILYGKDVDGMLVVDEAKRFAMMGNRRVIIVKEAQQLKNIEALLDYIKNPVPNNILVLAHKHKKMDGKKTITKQLRQKHVYLESKKLYDNQIPPWITNHLKAFGYHIEPKAALMLAEFVGSNLSRLNNELKKLMLVVSKSSNITPDDIEKNIGVSKDYNNFEFISALAHKDVLKANKIVKYFSQNPKKNPVVVTNSLMYSYFSKMLIVHATPDKNEYNLAKALGTSTYGVRDHVVGMRHYSLNKTVRIIGYLAELDVKSKGVDNVSTNEYDLLRECVFKILH